MGSDRRFSDAVERLRIVATRICHQWLIALALIFALAIGVAACQRPPNAAPIDDPRGGKEGKRLFAVNCANCHGEKGDRLPVAPLASKEFLDSRGDATLLAMISEGKGTMPGFSKVRGGPLADTEINALVAYISTAAGRTSSSELAESGKQVFSSTCTTCHGEKGDRIPIVPLSAKGYLDNRTDSELIRAITDGKGVMPAFGKSASQGLTDQQIKAVVAYLRFTVDSNVAASARIGRDLYMGNCLSCHGERGERIPGINLPSSEYLSKLGDGGLISTINEGKGVMPGFGRAKGGSFSVLETAALLAYMKSWAGLSATSALAGAGVGGEGKDLFARNCVPCHGDGGDKVPGVRLKSADFLQSRTDSVLLQTITDGNAKGMPAWGKSAGGPFTVEQTRAILDYLKSSAGATSAPVKAETSSPSTTEARPLSSDLAAQAAKGKEVFTKNCVACHGETRDKMPTCKLTDKDWVAQKGDEGLTNSITNGKGPMPAWGKAKGGALSDDDIKSVVAYLKQAVGLGGGAGVGAAATGTGASVPTGAPTATAVDEPRIVPTADIGKELFFKNCTACHGEDGLRVKQCPLGSRAWLNNTSEESLRARITGGKPAAGMPTWGKVKGGSLSDSQISAVMLYLSAAAK